VPKIDQNPTIGGQALVRYRPRPKAAVAPSTSKAQPRPRTATRPVPVAASAKAPLAAASPASAPLAVAEEPAALAEVVGLEPDRNPAAVYLARLRTTKSRRAMRGALVRVLRAAGALGAGEKGVAATKAVMGHPWARWRYAEVVAARAALAASGASPRTVNQALAALRGVLREAFRLELLDGESWSRVREVEGLRSTRLPAGRCLAPAEVELLLATAKTQKDPARAARDAALLAVLRLGGCRLAEVAQLQLEAVDMTRGEAKVIGKGDKERLVFFADALPEVRAWVERRGPQDGPLFYSFDPTNEGRLAPLSEAGIYYAIKRLAKEAGVPMTTHDLRRTFITELLDAGADVVAVQKIVGHAQVTTTAAYDRRPEERLRAVAAGVKLPRKK
jgi:site-specific recombinase XerD